MAQKKPRHHKNNAQNQGAAGIDRRVAEAALQLADKHGWHGVSLKAVAAKTRLPTFTVALRYPHASDILRLILKNLSAEVKKSCAPHMGDNWRENLTEILMQRFEYANRHRTAYASLFTLARKDPATALTFLPMLQDTMKDALILARLPVQKELLDYAAALLAPFYLMILKAWHADLSSDMTQTMAAIDRRIGTFEKALQLLGFLKRNTNDNA